MRLVPTLLICIAAVMLHMPSAAGGKPDGEEEISDGAAVEDIVDTLSESVGISKADAKKALDSFIDTTSKALKKGDRPLLVGFGTFSASKRAARTGRNPQTGAEIKKGQQANDIEELSPFVSSVEVSGATPDLPTLSVEVVIPPSYSPQAALLEFQIPEKVVMEKQSEFSYQGVPASDATVTVQLDLDLPETCRDPGRSRGSFVTVGLSYNAIAREPSERLGEDAARAVVALSVARPDLLARYENEGDQASLATAIGIDEDGLDSAFAPQDAKAQTLCDIKLGCGDKPSYDEIKTPADQITAVKADIVSEITEQTGIEKSTAAAVVDFLTSTADSLRGHQGLVGFGSFSSSTQAARTGRNPQTGKEIQISRKRTLRYRSGKTLSRR